MSKRAKSAICALAAAFIWGFSFVAQKCNTGGTLSFLSKRAIIATITIGLVLLITEKFHFKKAFTEENPVVNHQLWKGGLIVGLFLTVASICQQLGMDLGTDGGKSAFLSTFYMVLVPVVGVIFMKKKLPFVIWIGVAICMVGMYLLSIKEGLTLELSDAAVILCSVGFCGHILSIGAFAKKVPPLKLSFVQFFVVAVVSTIAALIFEDYRISFAFEDFWPVLYLGVMSWGVAFTLQVYAQKYGYTTVVTLLLGMESVFGVFFTSLVLSERMTLREYLGSALILGAVIMVELLDREQPSK